MIDNIDLLILFILQHPPIAHEHIIEHKALGQQCTPKSGSDPKTSQAPRIQNGEWRVFAWAGCSSKFLGVPMSESLPYSSPLSTPVRVSHPRTPHI